MSDERAAFTVTVYGTPAPQGSKRHVGNGVMVESSKAVAPWREAVKLAALYERGGTAPWSPTLDEALRAEVVFTVRKPTSAPKRRRTWPDRHPDIDKMLRATFDALTDAGAVRDDGRFVEVVAVKCYPGEHPDALDSPGCVIRLYRLTEEPC